MVKLLLSLSLVVTQLLSWSASPLFLCVSSDGSVCVDAGPDACDCCDSRLAAGHHCASGDCGNIDCANGNCASDHDHEHAAGLAADAQSCADEGGPSLANGCGCRHLQLSQGSVIASRGATAHDVELHCVAPALHAAIAIPPSLMGLDRWELLGASVPNHFAAHVVGSVLLRC